MEELAVINEAPFQFEKRSTTNFTNLKQNQGVLAVGKEPTSIEEKMNKFLKSNIVFFFQFLRFEAFPDEDEIKKKNLLTILASVSCKDRQILSDLLESVESNDINRAFEIASSNSVSTEGLHKQAKSKGLTLLFVNDYQAIFDAYFKEPDQDLSFRLLNTFLFQIRYPDQKTVEKFMESYLKMNKEERNMSLSKEFWSSFNI